MARIFLQNIIEDLRFEDLPAGWNSFDLKSFSKYKTLWDYQQDAIKNAIKEKICGVRHNTVRYDNCYLKNSVSSTE